MRKTIIGMALGVAVVAVAAVAAAESYSIPPEKLDDQKVFWGVASSFEKPAHVNYKEIVKATPEYQSIKKKKIKSGTAKYWILISEASDHAVRVIAQIGQETDYDLICAQGYIEGLELPVKAEDLTERVLEKLK